MRYLLTEEEFRALTPKIRLDNANAALEQARELIVELTGTRCGHVYCESCPLGTLRSYDMEKGGEERRKEELREKHNDLICKKSKNYGK